MSILSSSPDPVSPLLDFRLKSDHVSSSQEVIVRRLCAYYQVVRILWPGAYCHVTMRLLLSTQEPIVELPRV